MDYDDAYANGPYIPGAEDYPERWLQAAADWALVQRAEGRHRGDLRYGDSTRTRFDLFYPQGAVKGLMVFVHGGYWLKFDRSYWFHLAHGMVAQGWAVAMPSYDLCPEVRIADITRQIAGAVNVAAEMVEGPMILCGHSAGGHLVARMLEPGMLDLAVAKRLQRVMPISPVSDLRPLIHTAMNADFKLTEADAVAESPALMTEHLDVPVTVWVGADERPVFLDQARWLAEAWGADHVIDAGKHHFDVIDGLADPDSQMIKTLLS
ncbi:alpha/beta hydrolase [Roseovarius sp. 2305UL8-3]|uniref:alpha/beta hydrolase n=1 Tax=Roseovarius conchicola TaxID=3121636 RepID=UPI0035290EFE